MMELPEESTYGDYQDAHNHHHHEEQHMTNQPQSQFTADDLTSITDLTANVVDAADKYGHRIVVAVFDGDDARPVAWIDANQGDDRITFEIPDWFVTAIAHEFTDTREVEI